MPRKKQKGPSPRANRPGGPKQGQAQGQGAGQGKGKGAPTSAQQKGGKQNSVQGTGTGSGSGSGPQKLQALQQNQRPIVPFLRGDRILLVGEGDFSFARSLAKQYKCRKLCATCYDSKETLYTKYPQADSHIQEILSSSKSTSTTEPEDKEKQGGEGGDSAHQRSSKSGPKVLFSIDARKLGTQGGGGKEIKTGFSRRERKTPAWKLHQQQHQQQQKEEQQEAARQDAQNGGQAYAARMKMQPTTPTPVANSGPWDVICFNFPHVGGLSTDVNRQVRANQELLVSFFKACVPLLSTAPEPAGSDDEWESGDEEDDEEEFSDDDDDDAGEGEGAGAGAGEDVQTTGKATRTGPGQILVSLFEAEPYTLWNIKDLARHAGLQVVTSFRFPWSSYEGYSHARTLGEVEGKDGQRGGWRGEDRNARMYVFEVRKEVPKGVKKKETKGGKTKRARDDSSDSE
ncbi:hypothetical protein N7481_006634 [Penicillium waksmanii]|uniref:uncharacterized protein n=1 Tax=Penicillium waksmanii TaxID=69791 RepID=UPI0025468578|nr:uncharacterized protein N7481_006634 [Penicillium waksmanii]KAJ5984535.1 hypothetical protein N7481_006634 [Penicillium waksmanii]